MTDKELRKLSRAELLEMLIAQMKENDTLRGKLDVATMRLQSKEIAIRNAGSIAEAALQLNDVFKAADAAAEQYLASVKDAYGKQQAVCDRREEETRQKCDAMIAETEERCAARERAMEERCNELTDQLRSFYDEWSEMRDTIKRTP